MAEYVYEGMFIIDSGRYARDPGGVSGQIPEMVEKCGGQMLASRLWNEQKLAFPIRGLRKGTYWLTYFRMDSNQLTSLDRECHLNSNILRNLVIKIDPRLSDTMVQHAQSQATVEAVPAEKDTSNPPAKGSEPAEKLAPK